MNRNALKNIILVSVFFFCFKGHCELTANTTDKIKLVCEVWFQVGDTAYSGKYLTSDRLMNGKFLNLDVDMGNFVKTTFTAPDLFEGSMIFGVYQYREAIYPGPGPKKLLLYLKQFKESNPIKESESKTIFAQALSEASFPLVRSNGNVKLSLHSNRLNLNNFRVECSVN